MYSELLSLNEVASALFIKKYIEDVDIELEKAEKYWTYKKSIGYDMNAIISEQEDK